MKNYKSVLILFAFLCLLSEARAQFNSYTRMRRGDVSQYDSSVNIEIKEYRLIRKKVMTADTLSMQLSAERSANYILSKSYAQQIGLLKAMNERQEATIYEKDMSLAAMATTVDDCTSTAKKFRLSPVPWVDTGAKTLVGVGIGLVVGILIAK